MTAYQMWVCDVVFWLNAFIFISSFAFGALAFILLAIKCESNDEKIKNKWLLLPIIICVVLLLASIFMPSKEVMQRHFEEINECEVIK